MNYPQWQFDINTYALFSFITIIFLMFILFASKINKLNLPKNIAFDGRKLTNLKKARKRVKIILGISTIIGAIYTLISPGLTTYPFNVISYTIALFLVYTYSTFLLFYRYSLKSKITPKDTDSFFKWLFPLTVVGGTLTGYASRNLFLLNPIEDAIITYPLILITTGFIYYSTYQAAKEMSLLQLK